jgi:hypothetical protein
LRALPDRQRDAIVLRELEGLSYDHIDDGHDRNDDHRHERYRYHVSDVGDRPAHPPSLPPPRAAVLTRPAR